MTVYVPNEGELVLLNNAVKQSTENWTLKLYSNDYTPVAADTSANYTEAVFTNYVAKTLAPASWNDSTTNVDGEAEIEYSAAQSWICGATGETIYGYYVVGATSGDLIYADRFPSSKAMSDGVELEFTPKITLRSNAC